MVVNSVMSPPCLKLNLHIGLSVQVSYKLTWTFREIFIYDTSEPKKYVIRLAAPPLVVDTDDILLSNSCTPASYIPLTPCNNRRLSLLLSKYDQLEFPFINKSITIGIKNSKFRIAPVSILLQ